MKPKLMTAIFTACTGFSESENTTEKFVKPLKHCLSYTACTGFSESENTTEKFVKPLKHCLSYKTVSESYAAQYNQVYFILWSVNFNAYIERCVCVGHIKSHGAAACNIFSKSVVPGMAIVSPFAGNETGTRPLANASW